MSSKNHDYSTRSKEPTNVTDTLSKIENKLMNSISDLNDEVINLKEIIIKKLQDKTAVFANKVSKLEDKIKNLETQNNKLDHYYHRKNV